MKKERKKKNFLFRAEKDLRSNFPRILDYQIGRKCISGLWVNNFILRLRLDILNEI